MFSVSLSICNAETLRRFKNLDGDKYNFGLIQDRLRQDLVGRAFPSGRLATFLTTMKQILVEGKDDVPPIHITKFLFGAGTDPWLQKGIPPGFRVEVRPLKS